MTDFDSTAEDPARALGERMLRLAWTISRRCASTSVRAARATRIVLRSVDWSSAEADPTGRALRTELITALADRWERRDPTLFAAVVAQAVMRDEYELLDPQPRGLLEAVIVNRLPLPQAAADRHLTPSQAALLLRTALLTLRQHANPL